MESFPSQMYHWEALYFKKMVYNNWLQYQEAKKP